MSPTAEEVYKTIVALREWELARKRKGLGCQNLQRAINHLQAYRQTLEQS